MVGLILTVIGYVIAVGWLAWRIIRIPAVNIREQDNRSCLDASLANGVLLLGYTAQYAGHTTSEVKVAAFLLALLGIVFLLVTLAADIKFTHLDK